MLAETNSFTYYSICIAKKNIILVQIVLSIVGSFHRILAYEEPYFVRMCLKDEGKSVAIVIFRLSYNLYNWILLVC